MARDRVESERNAAEAARNEGNIIYCAGVEVQDTASSERIDERVKREQKTARRIIRFIRLNNKNNKRKGKKKWGWKRWRSFTSRKLKEIRLILGRLRLECDGLVGFSPDSSSATYFPYGNGMRIVGRGCSHSHSSGSKRKIP